VLYVKEFDYVIFNVVIYTGIFEQYCALYSKGVDCRINADG